MKSSNSGTRDQPERRGQSLADVSSIPEPATPATPRPSTQRQTHARFPCEHCRKEYGTIHRLENHQRASCNASKRNISELLLSTKEFWESKKKRRLVQNPVNHHTEAGSSGDDVHTAGNPPVCELSLSTMVCKPRSEMYNFQGDLLSHSRRAPCSFRILVNERRKLLIYRKKFL